MICVPLVFIVHVLLVAVERFAKIVYPLHYHRIVTRSRSVVLIVLTWLFPFSVSLLPFMGIHQNMESTDNTDNACVTFSIRYDWFDLCLHGNYLYGHNENCVHACHRIEENSDP